MLKTNRNYKREWLIGTWYYEEAVSPIRFTIEMAGRGFGIQAIDESDGEELVISGIRWSGKALTFETFTPSNGWRTRNKLTPISKSKAVHELTFWENWTKVANPIRPPKRVASIKNTR